jgi:hypothetical protein
MESAASQAHKLYCIDIFHDTSKIIFYIDRKKSPISISAKLFLYTTEEQAIQHHWSLPSYHHSETSLRWIWSGLIANLHKPEIIIANSIEDNVASLIWKQQILKIKDMIRWSTDHHKKWQWWRGFTLWQNNISVSPWRFFCTLLLFELYLSDMF